MGHAFMAVVEEDRDRLTGLQCVVRVLVQLVVQGGALVHDRRHQADDQPDDDPGRVEGEAAPEERAAERRAAVPHAAASPAGSGTRPVTWVPRLGAELTSSDPPSATTRSTMLPSPEPGRHSVGSKPDPSSRTENMR